MAELFRFRVLIVVTAIMTVGTFPSLPMAQVVPLSEGAPASGEIVPQSGNCPGGRQRDADCLPGGAGSSAGSDSTPTPPVTPPIPPATMPPVTFPIVPPSERPSATRPQGPVLPLYVIGSAKATFHIHDADRDIVYTSDEVPLTFLRRVKQDKYGTTQYILVPVLFNTVLNSRGEVVEGGKLQVIWMAEGREFDCTVKGKAIVTLPTAPGGRMYLDPTTDPTQPAYGYLNVVGPDGGDFHSVMIKAFNPDARLIKTCPGDPPLVTEEKFDAGFLLHILSQKNTYTEDGRMIFQGHQEYDQGNPLDFLNLLPPGADIPEEARRALQASGSGTSLRYTWTWKLIPVSPPTR